MIAVFKAKPTAGAERGSPVVPESHQLEGLLELGDGYFVVGGERLTDEADIIEQFQLVR